MAEILHQLRLVVYPTIYRVSYIPGGAGYQPSTGVTYNSYFAHQVTWKHSIGSCFQEPDPCTPVNLEKFAPQEVFR